tara:strand:- start:604 stop:984 length:381 start_codon:yes stop_codon:yes gene_type:complete
VATVIKIKRSETPSQIPGSGALEAGELAMNVTDGKLYTKTTGGVVKEVGGAGAVTLQAVTTSGNSSTNDIQLNNANIIFEGSSSDAYETTLTVANPTRDNTITFPNQSGTVGMDGDALAYSIVFGG